MTWVAIFWGGVGETSVLRTSQLHPDFYIYRAQWRVLGWRWGLYPKILVFSQIIIVDDLFICCGGAIWWTTYSVLVRLTKGIAPRFFRIEAPLTGPVLISRTLIVSKRVWCWGSEMLRAFVSGERRFVVLKEGFVYFYSSETAKKATKVLDLGAFKRYESLFLFLTTRRYRSCRLGSIRSNQRCLAAFLQTMIVC